MTLDQLLKGYFVLALVLMYKLLVATCEQHISHGNKCSHMITSIDALPSKNQALCE